MLTKSILKNKFSREWKKQYEVELFRVKCFARKTCVKCKKNFWTLDQDRKTCPDSTCQSYDFIGNPITKKKWDYVEMWKEYEKFFVKNGHANIPRYPVIDRWRPDLFFTIASIQDFQRIDNGNITFEYPADPLIVPQMCLRFNDIQNVGVTGRHHTSFIMSGQHSFGDYWKDRTIELNFEFLNKVMGIPEEKLVYIEDLWSMPDFSAFGPSLETVSSGLELVNSVFQQFTSKGSSYRELPMKVIDVGWGHERLAWFSNGTVSGYDVVFGPVIKWLKNQTGFKETDLFEKYALHSGSLDFEDVDVKKEREKIAESLGISVNKLKEAVEPMHALYAIADHAKTLLFAVTDGGIPSNTGGGYNLRVILRRMLSFMKEYSFDFDIHKVGELHSKHLKKFFPDIKGGLDTLNKIIELEEKKYDKTLQKAGFLIRKELEKGGIDTKTMIKLYTSNGITPELIEKADKNFKVPEDFYPRLTERHMAGEKVKGHKIKLNTEKITKTELLFYKDPHQKEFDANVLKVVGDWVILDRTAFYPEGGGQPEDKGTLETEKGYFQVIDTQKISGIVVHKVKNPQLGPGDRVHGKIDWERRSILMKMHDATHIVAGAARKIIGQHVWQAGAQKGVRLSRIDLTHYQPFSLEDLEAIEDLANRVVNKSIPIKASFLNRTEAESKFGFTLYQGGASPGKTVRVVDICGFDAEACGGTHGTNTKETELIKISRTERIQDGINRIEFVAGPVAHEFVKEERRVLIQLLEKIYAFSDSFVPAKESVEDRMKEHQFVSRTLAESAGVFSVEKSQLLNTLGKFTNEIIIQQDELNKIRKKSGQDELYKEHEDFFKVGKIKTVPEISQFIFDFWKYQKKKIEGLRKNLSLTEANSLIEKAKNKEIFEVLDAERKDLIEIASSILSLKPEMTVILANQKGDVVGMSQTQDMNRIVREICTGARGSGGGKKELAQGKAELSKLLKIIDKRKG